MARAAGLKSYRVNSALALNLVDKRKLIAQNKFPSGAMA